MCAQMNKESIFLSFECTDFSDGFFFKYEMLLELNPDNDNVMKVLYKLKKKEVRFGIFFAC
jgi:hypothetical protein